MRDNWKHCLSLILKEEGGNDDDPRDPGGRTSRGVTQERWNQYRKEGHSDRPSDVWKAPQKDIEAIYKKYYWDPQKCDDLPSGMDLMHFNTTVNSGPGRSVKELQRAVRVPADGKFGPQTLDACINCTSVPAVIEDLAHQRRNFYKSLKTFKTFGRGWLARTDRI